MRALVTGGGGFLGRRVVELLLERGDQVSFLARGKYPEVEALGAVGHQVDLCDREALRRVVPGHDVIFHIAAKAGYWGKYEDFHGVNVEGTRNLLDAAEDAGVKHLVYTSTPSVIGYEHEAENAGQDVPYASSHQAHYPATKAEAEKMVLAANGSNLASVALRPHLIFGPGDNNLLPRVIQRAEAGRLPIIGNGKNVVDMTYIDNAAWAHLDAADRLATRPEDCAGRAYFISNDEPVVLWDWLNELLSDLDITPINRRISLGLARAVGQVLEGLWTILPLSGEPRMTPFIAAALARSHWYDMGPAYADLGYRVRVPMDEATRKTVAWFKEQRA
jgi:2-alkyl-3-oxoalkanoate reductase